METGLYDGASWVGQQAEIPWAKRTDPEVSRIMRPSIAIARRVNLPYKTLDCERARDASDRRLRDCSRRKVGTGNTATRLGG